jgi:hypothetical protein
MAPVAFEGEQTGEDGQCDEDHEPSRNGQNLRSGPALAAVICWFRSP